MRILQLIPQSFETPFFTALAKGLSDSGVKQDFATVRSAPPPSWLDEVDGRHFCLNASSRLSYPFTTRTLSHWIEREQVDIVHAHLFDASLLAAWIAGRGRARIVVSRHHLDDVLHNGTALHVRMDKWITKRSDQILVPSDAVREFMRHTESSRTEHVRTIPYGFNFDDLAATDEEADAVRRELGLTDAFLIGVVARFIGNKGHRFLFVALPEIARAVKNVKVLLLGNGDEDFIRRQVRECGVTDQIVFGGYRQDIAACMKAFDVLVHPTLSESFGQVLVEAMSVETPVVSSRVGGTPSIITQGETGVLVPPEDPDAIADAVIELHREPELARSLGRKARASVLERFNVPRMIEDHLDCYQELLTPIAS